MKLSQLRTRHLAEEKALVREALRANGWCLADTAAALGVQSSSLRRTIAKLGLLHLYSTHNAGPGRPRKSEPT